MRGIKTLGWLGLMATLGATGCHSPQTRVPQAGALVPGEQQPLTAAPAAPTGLRGMLARKSASATPAMKPETKLLLAEIRSDMVADNDKMSQGERAALVESARKFYAEALEAMPDNPEATRGLARLASRAGDQAAAEAGFRRYLQLSPKDAECWNELAMIHIRRQDFQTASGVLQEAVGQCPGVPTLKKSLGFCLAQAGQPDAGLKWLAQTMPEADARANLAGLYTKLNQPEAARRQLELALKADPKHPGVLAMLNPEPAAGADDVQTLPAMPIVTAEPIRQTSHAEPAGTGIKFTSGGK